MEHRRLDDSGSESSTANSEGRRISVRQTELAYRFKEIVVRKMPGYMHVSLVSHTRAKNAVNPKVFQHASFTAAFYFDFYLTVASCTGQTQTAFAVRFLRQCIHTPWDYFLFLLFCFCLTGLLFCSHSRLRQVCFVC